MKNYSIGAEHQWRISGLSIFSFLDYKYFHTKIYKIFFLDFSETYLEGYFNLQILEIPTTIVLRNIGIRKTNHLRDFSK